MRHVSWLEKDLVGDTSAHEHGRQLWLRTAAKTAIRSRGLLLAALAAVSFAVVTGPAALWWIVPGLYLLRFVIALLDPGARHAAWRLAQSLPIELPPAADFCEDQARRLLERLDHARQATESAINTSPAGKAFAVSPLLARIPQLERDVVVLAARIEYLNRFLDTSPPMVLLAEITEIEAQRHKVECTTSKQLDQVLDRCHQHLDLLHRLNDQTARAAATAEELVQTLEQIPARIVSLQLARIASCDLRADEAAREAATVVESFDLLEGTISGLEGADASPS